MAKAARLRAFVVFGKGEPEKLSRLAADRKIEHVNVAYLRDGKDAGPRGANVVELYKLNPEAKNTVLVYNKGMVTANFVNLEASDFGKLEEAVKKCCS